MEQQAGTIAFGLYGRGNAVENLYERPNANKKYKKASTKKTKINANAETGLGRSFFLNSNGCLNATGNKSLDDMVWGLDYDFVLAYDPETGKTNVRDGLSVKGSGTKKVGEPVFAARDGQIKFEEGKTKINDDWKRTKWKPYYKNFAAGDFIGIISDVCKDRISIQSQDGKNLGTTNITAGDGEGTDWTGANLAVQRKLNDIGDVTEEPLQYCDVTSLLEKSINIATLGGYKATMKLISLPKLFKDLFSKKGRQDIKEYREIEKSIRPLKSRLDTIKGQIEQYNFDLIQQEADLSKKETTYAPETSSSVLSKQLLDFTTSKINGLMAYYNGGLALKNYLDKNCKKASGKGVDGTNVEYADIIDRIYWGMIWYRNYYADKKNYTASAAEKNGNGTLIAQEILKATDKSESHSGDLQYGFTKQMYNDIAFHSSYGLDKFQVVCIAKALKDLKLGVAYDAKNPFNQEYYECAVRVACYAFWNYYLKPLTADKEGSAYKYATKAVITPLTDKGMGQASIENIVKSANAANTELNFYENAMLGKFWINNLNCAKNNQYEITPCDATYFKEKLLYDEAHAINTQLLQYGNRVRALRETNEAVKTVDNMRLCVQNAQKFFTDAKNFFDKDSLRNKAIQEAKKLRAELIAKHPTYLDIEVKMQDLEIEMDKLKKDIDTYQKVYESNEGDVEKQADSMLDKLTDDLDKKIAESDEIEAKAIEYDEKTIQPLEKQFEAYEKYCGKIERMFGRYKRQQARQTYRVLKRAAKDKLKDLYGKGWRKKGNYQSYKNDLKVDKMRVLAEYESVWSKVSHVAMAGILLPARNIITVVLMLNLGGITTRLEQMKKIYYDNTNKSREAINIRNYYYICLRRWYAIGGKIDFIEKIIDKFGKAKAIECKSDDLEQNLQANGYTVEGIAEESSEIMAANGMTQGMTARQYYNSVIATYIKKIISTVKGWVGWVCDFLGKYGKAVFALFTSLFGGKGDDDVEGMGLPSGYNTEDEETFVAEQIKSYQDFKAQGGLNPMPTGEQEEKILGLIMSGYTWVDAVKEVTGQEIAYETDRNGNTKPYDKGKRDKIVLGVGIGVGVIAIGAILYAVLSDK